MVSYGVEVSNTNRVNPQTLPERMFKEVMKDLWSLYLKTKYLSSLHDKYVFVPADKASNNIVFVCKSHYYECLIKELGINNNTSGNTTYKPHYASKQFHNISVVPLLLQTESLSGE
jgi:hypothetical protein